MGVLPAFETSSGSLSGSLSIVVVILVPIITLFRWLLLLCRSSRIPMRGRALENTEATVFADSHRDLGEHQQQPPPPSKEAGIAVTLKGHIRVDIDSTRNKLVVPLCIFLAFYSIPVMIPALAMGQFRTAPVTIDVQLAMQTVAQPEGDINAGLLGLSGMNWRDGLGFSGYGCSELSGSDHDVCEALAAVGILSLVYGIILLLCSLSAAVWVVITVRHNKLYSQRIGAQRPLVLPPRVYTLVAVMGTCMDAIILVWGVSGKYALDTGAIVHEADFAAGISWYLVFLARVHVMMLEFLTWHIVEANPTSKSSEPIGHGLTAA